MSQASQPQVVIASHVRPHLSDYLSFLLLQRFGGALYPDVNNARIALVDDGRARLFDEQGEPSELLDNLKSGAKVIVVGIGGGPYDEHTKAARDECEATLVASDLGIRSNPKLKDLLDYTLGVDRKGDGKKLFDLGRTAEILHDVYPRKEKHVRSWAFIAIETLIGSGPRREELALGTAHQILDQAIYEVRTEFTTEVGDQITTWWKGLRAKEPVRRFGAVDVLALMVERKRPRGDCLEWAKDTVRAEMRAQELFLSSRADFDRAVVKKFFAPSGKEKLVVLGQSGKRRFHQFCFHHEPRAAVVIIRRPSGHVQIFKNPKLPHLPVEKYVTTIRRAEQKENGVDGWAEKDLLEQNGPIGAGCWFYQRDNGLLLNGSLTARDVPITKLTDKEIQKLVLEALR